MDVFFTGLRVSVTDISRLNDQENNEEFIFWIKRRIFSVITERETLE